MVKKLFLVLITLTLLSSVLLSGCISGDSDGDGLSDSMENNGWQITIYHINGTDTTKKVTSNPSKADTDGDGLNDYEEMRNFTDPRSIDTDGDGLNDFEELSYGTSPIHYDTWNITVRGKTWRVKTDFPQHNISPTDYDTDGDGLFDYDEYLLGTDPTDEDTDGDGTGDWVDPEPLWNLTLTLTLNNFTLQTATKDSGGGADLYFVINVGNTRISTSQWNAYTGTEIQLNDTRTVDFPDWLAYNTSKIKIEINAVDEDTGGLQQAEGININGSNSAFSIAHSIDEKQTDYSTNGNEGKLSFTVEINRI